MRTMVEDLLLLAKNDERGMPLRRDDVDLDDIVLSEATRARELGTAGVGCRDARICRWRCRWSPRAWWATRTRSSAWCATSWTTRAATPGSRCRWCSPSTARSPARRGPITVDDDGEGVQRPEEHGVRPLRPPRRRPRTGHRRVGLGLAIVAEITRSHGGRVRVEDAPGGGARFVVELPVEQLEEFGD